MAIVRKTFGEAVRRFGSNLSKNRDGTAILEFAIVGPAFIALLLAILYTMMIYLSQQMLETAAQSAGRLLLTGSAQTTRLTNGHVGMSASDFKDAICNGFTGTAANGQVITVPSMLPPMLSCSRLTVNVITTSSYNIVNPPTFTYDSNGVLTSTGTSYNYLSSGNGQNAIVVIQLIYLLPTGKGPLGLNLIDQPDSNHKLVATSVFTTENYTCNSSQTSC